MWDGEFLQSPNNHSPAPPFQRLNHTLWPVQHNRPLPAPRALLHEFHSRLYPGTYVPVISGRTIENIEILVTQLVNMQKSNIFTAVLHKEEDMYVAECPEVGTFSQGITIEEAVDNLKEATELYLEEFPVEKEFKSIFTTFEVASIAEA